MVALAEAFEDEKRKLETNKKHFHQNQLQLLERKRELKTKRKALNDVAKSLLKLEKSLVNKLQSTESFAQVNIVELYQHNRTIICVQRNINYLKINIHYLISKSKFS